MEYYAHIDEERKQTVKEHLQGTAELAKNFATKFGNGDWGYCCGMLHDIGKYSKEFQDKIQNGLDVRVDHSTAGAKVGENISSIISYCIAGHHAGLPDTGRKGLPSSLIDRLEKKICDYSAYKKEITIPVVKSVPFDIKQVTDFDFSLSVFIRMLYSCLVDADFLNTEDFMKNGKVNRDPGESVELLLERLKSDKSKWFDNYDLESIGGRRSEILRECMKKGTLSKGLYQLTVPTGGGKTIASLAFALQHAVKNNMKRVIYVIPYTSIIEQNAKVFREILGNYNVLENHCNVDYESSEDFIPLHLAAENWDTVIGELMHKKAHDPYLTEKRKDTIIVRALPVVSKEMGITGECDVVEFRRCEDGVRLHGHRGLYSIYPVEYKKGKPKTDEKDQLQLAAQAMCLEEMFSTKVKEGALFYGETKRREIIHITDELRLEVRDMFQEMHHYFSRHYTPKVKTSKSCSSCSLKEICLPKLSKTVSVGTYVKRMLQEEDE